MGWDGYTVFSVLSGITLVILAFTLADTAKEKTWMLLGGLLIAAYGFYVASQTSGTFRFPVYIFVIPFGAVAYFFWHRREKARGGQGRAATGAAVGSAAVGPALIEEMTINADGPAVLEALREGVTAQRTAPVLVGDVWRRIGSQWAQSWAWGINESPLQVVLEVMVRPEGAATRCRISVQGTGPTFKAREDVERARTQIRDILRRLDAATSKPA